MKEKLVELIFGSLCRHIHKSCKLAENIADDLIANSVTVQDKTEISDEFLEQLRNTPVTILQEEPAVEVVQEWISVKDRLPIEEAKAYEQEWCEEYPEFIVMIERGLLPTTLYYDWENNEWFRINTTFERETYKVTHWMPLPQPPKGEKKTDE